MAGLRITSLLVNSMCNEYQTFMCTGACVQQSGPFHFSKFYDYNVQYLDSKQVLAVSKNMGQKKKPWEEPVRIGSTWNRKGFLYI